MSIENNKLYSISEVSQITGVNTVTLRAWQRRYGLLVPQRTPKGHRLYSDADIQKIEQILAWLAKGVSIGKVKPLLADNISAVTPNEQQLDIVEDVVKAIEAMNAVKLQQLISESLKVYPFDVFESQLLQVVTDYIHRKDNPLSSVQWSLWSSALTQCFIAVIAKINNPKLDNCLVLSFDEHSDFRVWQQALKACYQKMSVTVLANLCGRLTGLAEIFHHNEISKLVVVGEQKLTDQQYADLQKLVKGQNVELVFSGSIALIHATRAVKDVG